jgi:hypothetical protein
MQEGYASVLRDPRQSVHGVLWDIALADMRALDHYEGVAQGLYRKVIQPVLREGGGSARALVYIGRGTQGGQARPGYLQGILAARTLSASAAGAWHRHAIERSKIHAGRGRQRRGKRKQDKSKVARWRGARQRRACAI